MTTAAQARTVAKAIAANAFHNVTYHDGDGSVLRQATHAQRPGGGGPLEAREAALIAGDTNAVLELFADDAMVVTSSGRLLLGKEQIRVWVDDQVKRRQREDAGARQVQGNKLTWAGRVSRDDWQQLGVSVLEVRQDAIVEGGKIRFFNTTFAPESADRLEAARRGKN